MDSPENLDLRNCINSLAYDLNLSYEEVVKKALNLYFFRERCIYQGDRLALVIPSENIDLEFSIELRCLTFLLLIECWEEKDER